MAKTEFKPLDMLKTFQGTIKAGEISFVDKNDKKILAPLSDLIKAFKKADKDFKKEKDKKKGLSDHLDSYEVHKAGQRLWRELMSASLRQIDPNSKGNSKLFEYLDNATKFEDLLYGLEPYYRDHTLHSLWVYLIGVKLMGKGGLLEETADKLNWYLFNDIEQGRKTYPYPPILRQWANFRKECFCIQLKGHKEAVWCIMALCHDLGYSLSKLDKLNEKVLKVLEYFHVSNFNHVGYLLDIEHQYLIEQFLELMAMDVRIVAGENYEKIEDELGKDTSVKTFFKKGSKARIWQAPLKDVLDKIPQEMKKNDNVIKLWEMLEKALEDSKKSKKDTAASIDAAKSIEENTLVKCYRDDSTYWRLCKALERKEHGILSAYLIYKTLGIFADTSVRGSAEEWGLEDEEVIYNVIRGDILFAVAQHEFSYAHIDQLGSLAEILILCDELEEFTRLGRQLQSRKYHDTAAKTKLTISNSKGGKSSPKNVTVMGRPIDIKMHYDCQHGSEKEFHGFLVRKCERLCRVYSLNQRRNENDVVYNPVRRVTASFKWKKPLKIHTFEMTGNSLYGKLCKTKYGCKEKKQCKFKRGCPVNKKSERKYEMECMDDKVLIKTKCTKEVTLRKWLDVEEDE